MIMSESVIDQPQTSLDKSVWQQLPDGRIVLQDDAKTKILGALKWLVSNYNVDFYAVHLIGSITSNSYTADSDIDIHVCSMTLSEDEESFNKRMKADYWENYYPTHESELMIGTHPIELYVQKNEFKNMASVGCFDILADEWLVGPQYLDPQFDPYKEYYNDDMKSIQFLIDDVRSTILEVYELATVILNSKDQTFINQTTVDLQTKLAAAAELFSLIRQSRSVIENPTSKEDALSKRASRKWKIADSTFKLLGKFGYIGILHDYASIYDSLSDSKTISTDDCTQVIATVDDNFSSDKITENEIRELFETDQVDEGLKDWIRGAALAGAMTASAVASASPSHEVSQTKPTTQMTQTVKTFAGLSYDNLKNMLANVAYNEAGIDWLKTKDDNVLIAILNVIDHRSGGDPTHYADEITAPSQFFGAKYVKGTTDSTFTKFDPNAQAKKEGGQLSSSQKTCWSKCNEFAGQLLDGKLKDVITTTLADGTVVRHNMIANQKKDNKSSYDSWGKACGQKPDSYSSGYDSSALGHHTFGYRPEHDGYAKYKHAKPINVAKLTASVDKSSEYVVKSGDTLGKIAADHNTSVKAILSKNSKLKHPDKIYVGQKIRI